MLSLIDEALIKFASRNFLIIMSSGRPLLNSSQEANNADPLTVR